MKLSSVTNARLAGGGDRVVWGAGLFALGGFADRVGLTEALWAAVPPRGERAPVHDRGPVLVHALLMLAGGGEACTDIEYLRAQRELFGDVASDSTLYRTLTGLGASGAAALLGAAAAVRSAACSGARTSATGDSSPTSPAALRRAAPQRLRWQLWHLPALVCHSARRVLLRLPEPHPGAKALLAIAHPR